MDAYPTLDSYLERQGVRDPYKIIYEEQVSLLNNDYITDMSFLHRTIKIHISSATNLTSYLKVEMEKQKGITFNSLSPMVRVECMGQVKETTVLKEAPQPAWDYTLTFHLKLPEGHVKDIVQFIKSQNIYFSLFDVTLSGLAPYNHFPLIL
jgi:hypothetical protein